MTYGIVAILVAGGFIVDALASHRKNDEIVLSTIMSIVAGFIWPMFIIFLVIETVNWLQSKRREQRLRKGL